MRAADRHATLCKLSSALFQALEFRVLALPSLDIATNGGRRFAAILASRASRERRRARDRHGIVVAKTAGRHLGRPPTMNGRQVVEARARLAGDEPARIVARGYRVSAKTLRATLAR